MYISKKNTRYKKKWKKIIITKSPKPVPSVKSL